MKNTKTQTSAFSNAPERGIFESHPSVVQSKNKNSEQLDLKASFIQAEKYGHHLSKTNLANQLAPAAVQSKPDNQPIQAQYRYVSNRDRIVGNYQIGRQVNHGPTADLNDNQQQQLIQHYGNGNSVLKRLNQYDSSHSTYVRAAQSAGRQLTPQERTAQNTNINASNASINHIIASGTGQNIINHETLRFNQGVNRFNQAQAQGQQGQQGQLTPQQVIAQRGLGIAEQAASVGRIQGYNRAIINERNNEPLNNHQTTGRIYGNDQRRNGLNVGTTGNRALTHTLTAFQGGNPQNRLRAYRDVLKMTFDSPGNIRVGDNYGNNQVSTGFDAPLNQNGVPTERANRLLAAHQTYAPNRLLTDNQLFSHDMAGNRLSSSHL